ncbi:M48 family metallopeptidase [Enorma phocaeensis]|uniref:M48 family metallopeptidase n=1 Tax=Enorma phocaeensis TaxID=1871019 RepID=A0A921IVK9_9ACTN|nr:M48 family metallopeptidase [Enorma phocaeensis]
MRRKRLQPQTTKGFTVRAGASTFTVLVTRKNVKNLNLRVRGDGTVAASAPLRTSDERIQAFLDKHAAWIERTVARKRSLGRPGSGDDGDVPSAFPLWGELVPMRELYGAHACGEGIGGYERLLAERYRDELARRLPAVAEHVEARMGVHASRWQIRTMKTRWGSCTPQTRAIRINARLAAYPPACLEFVVAHELCHLLEPSHNARFHVLLDRHCPKNRELAKALRLPAAELAQAHDLHAGTRER